MKEDVDTDGLECHFNCDQLFCVRLKPVEETCNTRKAPKLFPRKHFL